MAYSAVLIFVCFFVPALCTGQYVCKNDVGDTHSNGACHVTTHSLVHPMTSEDVTFIDDQIKEWHFHVYWFQTNMESYDAAMRFRQELLEQVQNKKFIVIFPGVTEEMVPGLDESKLPHINTEPRGPHPCGSYEVWVPKEYVAEALDYFMRRRGDLTILIHPLATHAVEDHSHRAMWLGSPYTIDFAAFHGSADPVQMVSQYPELGLGYAAP